MLSRSAVHTLWQRLQLRLPRADALILALFSLVQVVGTLWLAVHQPFGGPGLDGRAILLVVFYAVLFIISMNLLGAQDLDRRAPD